MHWVIAVWPAQQPPRHKNSNFECCNPAPGKPLSIPHPPPPGVQRHSSIAPCNLSDQSRYQPLPHQVQQQSSAPRVSCLAAAFLHRPMQPQQAHHSTNPSNTTSRPSPSPLATPSRPTIPPTQAIPRPGLRHHPMQHPPGPPFHHLMPPTRLRRQRQDLRQPRSSAAGISPITPYLRPAQSPTTGTVPITSCFLPVRCGSALTVQTTMRHACACATGATTMPTPSKSHAKTAPCPSYACYLGRLLSLDASALPLAPRLHLGGSTLASLGRKCSNLDSAVISRDSCHARGRARAFCVRRPAVELHLCNISVH
mmetsp:Transcript_30860/g.80474  ORF Transcript_30860/g.80474 Transcript_30860/m.80474 type:complete len:311 (+) Transcript_30860:920-1852(+)